jgi:hypothetical protein
MTDETKARLEKIMEEVWPHPETDPNVRFAMNTVLTMPGNQAFLAGVYIGARLMARRMCNYFKPVSMP